MSLVKPRQTFDKTKYLEHCSKAELSAMYLNGEISDDEYFEHQYCSVKEGILQ